MIIRTTLFGLFILWSLGAAAQQEEQYTQFMQNKMAYNPAYAGSEPATAFTLLSRNQWLGLEGAPQTQMVGVNMPVLNQRIGVGINLFRHSIGITNKYTGTLSYAYHLNLGRGTLGLGVQGSVRLLQIDFSQVQGAQPISQDPAIPAGLQSKYVPNFGAGIYFNNKKFYLGISAPRLLNANIDLADNQEVITREVSHFYLMSGLVVDLSDKVSLQPNLLVKYVNQAPFDADVNVSFVFDQKFIAGGSYRLGGSRQNSIGESLSGLVGFKFGGAVTLSISYDATLTALRQFNSGTIEGVLHIGLGEGKEPNKTAPGPRDFF